MKVKTVKIYDFKTQNFKMKNETKSNSKWIKYLSIVPYPITSKFQQQESFRINPHNGIDLKMETGEPLRAIVNGKVHVHDYGNVNAGKTILIETENNTFFIYGHLSKFNVSDGDVVNVGELIGYAGNSGFSTGSHLHFGIRVGNEYINPSPYIELIQNMNNPKFLANAQQLMNKTEMKSYSFSDLFNFSDYSINCINFNLLDNVMFLEHVQKFF